MRQIRVSRIDTSRDPGIPGAVWYGGAGSINEPAPRAFEPHWMGGYEALLPPDHPLLTQPPLDQYYEQLPEPPAQHNDHVMKYWTWRLDRLEARRNG